MSHGTLQVLVIAAVILAVVIVAVTILWAARSAERRQRK